MSKRGSRWIIFSMIAKRKPCKHYSHLSVKANFKITRGKKQRKRTVIHCENCESEK